jgi:predicted ArsR family transcriptional regulator
MIDRRMGDKDSLQLTVFEPGRRRVADALRSRPGGYWTVDEIAAREGIHRTVAFDHLRALVEAGLATRVRVKGAGRGRPANAYRYSGGTLELSYPPRQNRLLAQILARSANRRVDPTDVARDVGREAGSLSALGGDHASNQRSVHARVCIFGSVCEGADDVVCAVHAGLIEGALGERGSMTPRGPDGYGGCLFERVG